MGLRWHLVRWMALKITFQVLSLFGGHLARLLYHAKSCLTTSSSAAAGGRTLFNIKVSSARAIQDFSALPKENELLILPGTPLKVVSVVAEGDLTTVHMEEDADAPDMIDSGEDHYQNVDWEDAGEDFYEMVDPAVFTKPPMELPGGATEPLYRPVHGAMVPGSSAQGYYAEITPFNGQQGAYGKVTFFGGTNQQSATTIHVVADGSVYEDMATGQMCTILPLSATGLALVPKITTAKSKWFKPHFTKRGGEDCIAKQPKGSFLIMTSSKTRDAYEEQAIVGSTRLKPYLTLFVKQYSRKELPYATAKFLENNSDIHVKRNPERPLFWRGLIEENDSKTLYFINLGDLKVRTQT